MLVVVDDSNPDVSVEAISGPLVSRGFEVSTAGIKDHPTLMKYGERIYDNLVVVPGRVKALGSTLRQVDLLEFLSAGGNIVALTTPKFSPLALRDLSSSFGIEVSGRGVEFVDAFNSEVSFPHPNIVSSVSNQRGSSPFSGSAVAKLGSNEYLLGLVQSPYTSYSWNSGKVNVDDAKQSATDVFTTGGEAFLAAGLQSLSGSRFVWVGSPFLLTDAEFGKQITSWAFGETGKLRLNGVTHQSDLPEEHGASHLHYMVEEPLKYCANIQEWNSEAGQWDTYDKIEDIQVEFKMIDPYYRLNLDRNGCVTFNATDQYGMFTFNLDYKSPGYTFLEDKQVITIRHRANDEWDRSWSITNSWVYLAGVSTTVFGFLLFCVLYLTLPSPYAAAASSSSSSKSATTSTTAKSTGKTTVSKTPTAKEPKKKPTDKNVRKKTSIEKN